MLLKDKEIVTKSKPLEQSGDVCIMEGVIDSDNFDVDLE